MVAVTAKQQEQFDAGLATRPDFTIDQPFERYGAVDHAVWNLLYRRQRALRMRYRIGTFQKTYFLIDSFAQLFDAPGTGIAARLADPSALSAAHPHAAGHVLHGDTIITRGTREGWLDDADVWATHERKFRAGRLAPRHAPVPRRVRKRTRPIREKMGDRLTAHAGPQAQ
ncbi:hypothetical protein SAMN05421548_11865 [Paraburkholderia lycopersici]|uniref:Uncharacterized protein n=1 Tax=Paraburkholderia lycopersici TaxID=416944 RepID=A0A1G6U3W1_9BURK|nr:hypothetical protein SAMN05421548_11865 [Paraburkholderia lycopersici]